MDNINLSTLSQKEVQTIEYELLMLFENQSEIVKLTNIIEAQLKKINLSYSGLCSRVKKVVVDHNANILNGQYSKSKDNQSNFLCQSINCFTSYLNKNTSLSFTTENKELKCNIMILCFYLFDYSKYSTITQNYTEYCLFVFTKAHLSTQELDSLDKDCYKFNLKENMFDTHIVWLIQNNHSKYLPSKLIQTDPISLDLIYHNIVVISRKWLKFYMSKSEVNVSSQLSINFLQSQEGSTEFSKLNNNTQNYEYMQLNILLYLLLNLTLSKNIKDFIISDNCSFMANLRILCIELSIFLDIISKDTIDNDLSKYTQCIQMITDYLSNILIHKI